MNRRPRRPVLFLVVVSTNDDLPARVARRADDQRRARRAIARRRAVVRRRRVAALAFVASAVVLTLWLSGGSAITRRSPTSPRALAKAVRTTVFQHVRQVRAAAPSLGSLPQTHAYPSGTSAQFRALMASLWAGVATNSLAAALPAFFPEAAYLQLKAITSASSDWTDRLVHDFTLDIASAH